MWRLANRNPPEAEQKTPNKAAAFVRLVSWIPDKYPIFHQPNSRGLYPIVRISH